VKKGDLIKCNFQPAITNTQDNRYPLPNCKGEYAIILKCPLNHDHRYLVFFPKTNLKHYLSINAINLISGHHNEHR
jgi:hypothetical protein